MKKWIQNQNIHKNKERLAAGILLILCMVGLFSSINPGTKQSGESYKEAAYPISCDSQNSDRPQDQIIKEKVRDRIIEEMNPKIARSKV